MKRKRMLLILGIVSVTLTLVVAGLVLAAPVKIDTFDVGTMNLFAGPPFTAEGVRVGDYVTDSSILGIERSICLTHTSGSSFAAVSVDSGGGGGDNQFKFGTQPGVLADACITWDGSDEAPEVLDKAGLDDGVIDNDITDGGTNSGFQVLVYETDGDFDLVIRVFTNTNWSTYTLELRDDVLAPGQSFFIPFNDLTTAGGTGAVFTDVGAIQFAIEPKELAVDLTLDLFEATSNTDWGDLPDTYSTTVEEDGAHHVISETLYLGKLIDYEATGVGSVGADDDDNDNFSDEDGVVEAYGDTGDNSGWMNGTDGGAVTVTVGGGDGCLSAWLDWDENGEFDVANENIITGLAVTSGTHKITFDVPAGTFGGAGTLGFYSRFRLYPDTGVAGCGDEGVDYYGEVQGGEVEDYYWEYDGPTAVTLSAIDAGPALAGWPALALIVTAVVGGTGLFVWKRRA
jgi:hypothetical protein